MRYCALILVAVAAVLLDPVRTYPHQQGLFVDIPEPENKDIVNVVKAYDNYANESEAKVSYAGAQLWKTVADNVEKRIVIGQLRNDGIAVWGGNATVLDILVRANIRPHVSQVLEESGIKYEVVIPDIQQAIDTENPPPSVEEEELANRKGHRMTWSAYHRLSDIHSYLDYLATTYPSLCTVRTIGSSIQGRPIKMLKVSNGNLDNKAIWIDGGIHAREWISPATVTYIINQIVENYDTESEDVKNLDWYFAPVLNPDGYEYSHTTDRLWRKNRSRAGQCSGTDLNRNFGYRWGEKGSSKYPCSETYGGTRAFSEPESVAVQNFIKSSGALFRAYISFHSYGQYILYPWGYDKVVPPDYKDLQSVGLKAAQIQLKETKKILEENERSLNKQSYSLQQELDDTIEKLKDTKEQNTALQLQLDNLTKTHQELRTSYEELLTNKRNLEARIAEIDSNFLRYKSELITVKEQNEKLLESETNLKKQLEIERLQSKTARLQNEKDAKCIQDLNRQVKEMERIIQRKHPDSVSALIVAAKNESDCNSAARTLLENRIKQLENEASLREAQSNNIFSEIQEKFNQMKAKYESHIEDLETHVNDLKNQLKSKMDTYDIYTQTYAEESAKITENIVKDVFNIGTQTEQPVKLPKSVIKKPERPIETKEETHLLATIRGLQADLTNKEKLLSKIQKELDEMRKTNRKLQRDRELSVRTPSEKRDNNKTVDKPIVKSPEASNLDIYEKEIFALRNERDKLKSQLCKLEDDYQNLKTKRLQDLNTLQEAHERELTTYMSNIGPMREQLDVQQITINTLQQQLANAKEELAIITVERDHLDSRLKSLTMLEVERAPEDATQLSLQKKIAYLERRYEEREHRLRAIVHGLAQKQVSARDCMQCMARQQQLVGYKTELDQLLATLRYLQ